MSGLGIEALHTLSLALTLVIMAFWLVVAFYTIIGSWTFWYLMTVKEPIKRPPPAPQMIESAITAIEWREPPNYVGPV